MVDEKVDDSTFIVITKRDARAAGLTHYYTGKPCPKGHMSRRFTKSSQCIECLQARRKSEAREGCQCSVEGCTKRRERKGFCPKHYKMWSKYGDPLTPPSRVFGAAPEWIEANKNYTGDECLIWPFGSAGFRLGGNGYGQVRYKGKKMTAHLLMCILTHGEKPFEGAVVRHSCGKGHLGCVAPKHLSWGTNFDNAADKIVHGTEARGKKNARSKLTDDDVRKIRELDGKLSNNKTAVMYEISPNTVKNIRERRTWTNVE